MSRAGGSSTALVKRTAPFWVTGLLVCGILGFLIGGPDGRALGGGIGAGIGLILGGFLGRSRGLTP
jgi:hypothetical protein